MEKFSFDIKCKKCDHEHNEGDLLSDGCLPCTYWGEDSIGVFYCNNCGEEIEVKEHVSRWWQVI